MKQQIYSLCEPRKICYINKLTEDNISIPIKATQYEPNEIKDVHNNLAVLKRIGLANKIHFIPEERPYIGIKEVQSDVMMLFNDVYGQ